MTQTFQLEDSQAEYSIVAYLGKAVQCYRTPKGEEVASPVEWDELPMLVQVRFEWLVQQSLEDGPKRLM